MSKWSTLLLALLALAATPAQAEEYEEGGKLYAVQGRKYVDQHEFSLSLGTVPMDAFYKGITGTFAYTFHFNDALAWEIVSGTYSVNVDTDLRKKLQTEWGLQPTEFPELTWLVNSNLLVKPFYGKLSLFNSSLVYTELFFTGGVTVARYEGREGAELVGNDTKVGPNVGLGLRFYLSRHFSLRFDVRDHLLVTDKFKNEVLLHAGLGLNLR